MKTSRCYFSFRSSTSHCGWSISVSILPLQFVNSFLYLFTGIDSCPPLGANPCDYVRAQARSRLWLIRLRQLRARSWERKPILNDLAAGRHLDAASWDIRCKLSTGRLRDRPSCRIKTIDQLIDVIDRDGQQADSSR